MATALTPTKLLEQKIKEAVSHLCPASILGKDPHAMRITCMGAKHAQALVACHCQKKILKRRLRVTVANSQDPRPPHFVIKDLGFLIL